MGQTELLSLATLADDTSIRKLLVSKCHQPDQVERILQGTKECASSLLQSGCSPDAGSVAWFIPGRIEIVGKHVDYAGGSSLTCAVRRGFTFVAVQHESDGVEAIGTGDESFVTISGEGAGSERTPWVKYPQTVFRRATRNFGPAAGARIAFQSSLPQAAGLSSSSALVTGFFLCLRDLSGWYNTHRYRNNITARIELAEYCSTLENGSHFGELDGEPGVGTLGGSQDHIAILCARENMVRRFSYLPPKLEEEIPFPDAYLFAVASSGIRAEKTGNALEAYNKASFLASELSRHWQVRLGRNERHFGEILTSHRHAEKDLETVLDGIDSADFRQSLRTRIHHFVHENRCASEAGRALRRGDLVDFGNVVDRSQWGAEAWLGNQTAETVYLAAVARDLGAVAASSFGAGFGGSVWAMISASHSDRFIDHWRNQYRKLYPSAADNAQWILETPGPAAFSLHESNIESE